MVLDSLKNIFDFLKKYVIVGNPAIEKSSRYLVLHHRLGCKPMLCIRQCTVLSCKKNVPKKSQKEVRKLQFEIELRQINIKEESNKERKLNEEEVKELMRKLVFEKKPKPENKTKNKKTIDNFFTKDQNRELKKAKNESRGKKDILKDIVCGDQNGRTKFCIIHLKQKLNLLKNKKTESKEWAWLHGERILNLKDDAPPSIRQKVQKTTGLIKKMLRKQGISITNPQFEHIGIETARFDIVSLAQSEGKKTKFDIASLAQSEGKKTKKKSTAKYYQTSKGGDKSSLREEQGDCCLFCGELLHSDCHIDHLFPKSKGGGNIILNKVVGHSVCNINKHNSTTPLDKRVLECIKENNLKKYNFIKKRLSSNYKLPEDMLALPQHTMFGAKLLQGVFIEEFKADKEKIQKIRPRDASYLKSFWFPYMNKQKRTLRYDGYKTPAQQEFKKELKLDSTLFPDNEELSLIALNNNANNWLKLNNERKLVGTPEEIDIGFNKFIIRNDKDKKIILSFEEVGMDNSQTNTKKKPKKIIKELDKLIELSIKEIFPKNKQSLLKNPDMTVKIYSDQSEQWLEFKNNEELYGKPKVCEYDNGNRYVPYHNIEILNTKNNTVEYKIKLKTEIAEKRFTVAVQPKEDDSIRNFHHALDAIVIAGKVDWDGIKRLNADIRERDYHERKKMLAEARKENAPKFHLFKEDENNNKLAPDQSSDWYIQDKENQRKIEVSKTGTEPLRKRYEEVIQRKPLEQISKKI